MKAYVDQIQKDWKHVESAQNLPFASVKKYGKNLSDFSTPYKAFEVITIDKNSPIEARAVRPVRTPKPPKTQTKTQRINNSHKRDAEIVGIMHMALKMMTFKIRKLDAAYVIKYVRTN